MSVERNIELFSVLEPEDSFDLTPSESRYDKCVNAVQDAISISKLNPIPELRILLMAEIAEKMAIVYDATNGHFKSVNLLNDGEKGIRTIVRHGELKPIVKSDTPLDSAEFGLSSQMVKQAVNGIFTRAFEHLQSGGQEYNERRRYNDVKRTVKEVPSGRQKSTHTRVGSSDNNSN